MFFDVITRRSEVPPIVELVSNSEEQCAPVLAVYRCDEVTNLRLDGEAIMSTSWRDWPTRTGIVVLRLRARIWQRKDSR
jgi:hypothetical protein